jgi:hypothetical protein
MQSANVCPADAEDYAVRCAHGRLTREEAEWYSQHLSSCAHCRAVRDEALTIIQALRDATSATQNDVMPESGN